MCATCHIVSHRITIRIVICIVSRGPYQYNTTLFNSEHYTLHVGGSWCRTVVLDHISFSLVFLIDQQLSANRHCICRNYTILPYCCRCVSCIRQRSAKVIDWRFNSSRVLKMRNCKSSLKRFVVSPSVFVSLWHDRIHFSLFRQLCHETVKRSP